MGLRFFILAESSAGKAPLIVLMHENFQLKTKNPKVRLLLTFNSLFLTISNLKHKKVFEVTKVNKATAVFGPGNPFHSFC